MNRRLPLLIVAGLLGVLGGCGAAGKPVPLAEPSLAVRAPQEKVRAVLGVFFQEMQWAMAEVGGEGLPQGHTLYRGHAAGGEAVTVRTAQVRSQAQVRIDIGAVNRAPSEAAADRLRDLFAQQGAKLEEPIEVVDDSPLAVLGG